MMREQVKPAPLVTWPIARHSMPTDLLGRTGRGVHHGQKRELHQQAEYIVADQSFSSHFLLAIGRRTIHRYGEWSPHLEEARSGILAGKRASEGRGALSGTLNA